MPNHRILLIEDDAAIRQGVADALKFAGYKTFEAANFPDGLEAARGVDADLVLLDLVLPGAPRGQGGLDILKEVRSTRPTLPVIVLTARGEEAERVTGLRLGADDYVVKPFGIKELLARVEAVLRRSPQRPVDLKEVKIPHGTADLARCEVRFTDGHRAELSEKEMELLRYLATNPDRAISREELLTCVWRIDPRGAETRTIDMHVARLREKLRDDPADPKIVLTVRGKGYAFGPTKELPTTKSAKVTKN
ncbi:MAG TPA: response regulator transcription factor [Tepidisphaeraceae bacterium]|nr:response regulator transcription factor [Tepidisphaeraceae bacterium]